jgi:fructose-bisphosphate aldolase class 1
MNPDTESTVRTLVADGKGILAADETPGTTAHLDAINRMSGPKPWKISFSYGRALQDAALETWHGRDENVKGAQEALAHRARCNGAASLGQYTDDMEASAATQSQRHNVHDD